MVHKNKWLDNLRLAIGILALAFPLLLMVTGFFDGSWTETSLSATYWSNSGVLFSSMLVMLSLMLMTYYGYDYVDNVMTTIAAVAMLFVALFPCEGGTTYLFSFIPAKATHIIHYVTAGITFSMLGVMSFFQFTKYYVAKTEGKKKRNLVYRICGIIIFASILGMLLMELIPNGRSATDVIRLFYWLESIVVWAFGISWLVKSGIILKD